MGSSDKALRKILHDAADFQSIDFDTHPIHTILAIQGGGSWSIAAAEAAKVITSRVLEVGSIKAISGTSGGAANAALIAKGLNEGLGAEGVARYLDTFWDYIKKMGSVFSVPRIMSNPYLPEEYRWPNIPQEYITLTETFRAINPLVQMSVPTTNIKALLDLTIGNWNPVQQGPTAVYVNTVQRNIFNGKEVYQVATGSDVDGDTVAASAGLDELGGHLKLKELISPWNWVQRDINRYKDGAYKLNPDLDTMLTAHDATDVIVIALHGADGETKSPREKKLYTDQIHRDLTSMQMDDGRRVNIHVVEISLPGNATSRLNTDPEYLELLKKLGRSQAEEQISTIMDSLGVRSSYRPKASLVQDMVEKRELIA